MTTMFYIPFLIVEKYAILFDYILYLYYYVNFFYA